MYKCNGVHVVIPRQWTRSRMATQRKHQSDWNEKNGDRTIEETKCSRKWKKMEKILEPHMNIK